jgi:branched-chain amino acid transport system ATP-binding protein
VIVRRQLEVRHLSVSYGEVAAVCDLSMWLAQGEIVALLGANGAGKTTTLKAILGMVRAKQGAIVIDGSDVTGQPAHATARMGIALVPEGRRIFKRMTVRENLQVGGVIRSSAEVRRQLESVHALFPRLKERDRQLAGTLSGGEQQMLAIGRAMMMRPQFVLFDEPSLGLAPLVVEDIIAAIRRICHDFGVGAILVEQNAEVAFSLADRAYVLARGGLVLSGQARELRGSDQLRKAYLGIGH